MGPLDTLTPDSTTPSSPALSPDTERALADEAAARAAGFSPRPPTILDSDTPGPGIRLATMHRVKGLDFTHVIMQTPAGTPTSSDPRDKSLHYVAATRCRKTLTVLRST